MGYMTMFLMNALVLVVAAVYLRKADKWGWDNLASVLFMAMGNIVWAILAILEK